MADTTATPKIVERHKVLAFYGVPTDDGVKYYRMSKFTQFSHSKNPIEYSRQYVDEPFQQTDVVGFAPSYAYAFDKHTNLPVQKDIIDITDGELLGDDAVRSIVLVDTSNTSDAYMRDYSVIPNTEGDNINIYTYSGNLKARGEKTRVTAMSIDNWQTITVGTVSGTSD
ncbi:MAG: hypothetical protein IJ874_09175 [Ruminococcus sp.]|nr:hypothetical protein [Ruminococcus sp.]